jgi:hypothetical protein
MIIRYEQLLVAIIVADVVNPLPAIPAPAPIPVGGVIVCERYAKEREVIESIVEKTPVAETILKPVAASPIEKTSIDEGMPAGRGCADNAVSTGDEHAPAGDHAATEGTATESAVESTATEPAVESTATEPAVESTATKSTVESTATEPAAASEPATRHRWRCHDDRCSEQGRADTTELLAAAAAGEDHDGNKRWLGFG